MEDFECLKKNLRFEAVVSHSRFPGEVLQYKIYYFVARSRKNRHNEGLKNEIWAVAMRMKR